MPIYNEIPDTPGLALASAADPTGNGEETTEIAWRDEHGDEVHPGIYVSTHGLNKRRIVLGTPGPGADAIFELSGTGKVAVVET